MILRDPLLDHLDEFFDLGHSEPFRKVEIAPEEIRTAQSVAAEVSELAVLRIITAIARSCARINCRDKGVGIKPLDLAELCTGKIAVAVSLQNLKPETAAIR